MQYEIYIPRPGKKESWVRLLLEAEDWERALEAGLKRLGEDGRAVERAVCEVRADGAMLVRDAQHSRTFLLRVLPDPAGKVVPAAPPRARPAIVQEPGPTRPQPSSPGHTATARVLEEAETAALPFSPPLGASSGSPRAEEPLEALLPLIREQVDTVRQFEQDLQGAAYHVLDLAMSRIPCESGSVLYTHVNGRELYFVAARGPKAAQVLSFRVPIGKGIVGYAVSEGTCLAVNDVRRDPRFFARISEELEYPVSTIMAAPILTRGKVYGALELINHRGGAGFSEEELRLFSYVGHRLAEHLVHVLG